MVFAVFARLATTKENWYTQKKMWNRLLVKSQNIKTKTETKLFLIWLLGEKNTTTKCVLMQASAEPY